MLNVTLLKVTHEKEADARKLPPYVKACDIYGIEQALFTVNCANAAEKGWREFLRLPRSEFFRAQEILPDFLNFDPYSIKQLEYLFQYRKPMISLERFPLGKALYAAGVEGTSEWEWNNGILKLKEGKIEGFIDSYRSSLQLSAMYYRMRDQNIAETLSNTEALIGDQYPKLKAKKRINLTFAIGYLHSPEKYSSIPIKVIDISRRSKILNLMPPVSENMSDYSPRDVLAFGLVQIYTALKMPKDYGRIKSATLEELKDMARSSLNEIRRRLPPPELQL